MLAIRAECGGMAEDNPAAKCLFVSGPGGNGRSNTLVNMATMDEADKVQDSDSSADYDAYQGWGVAEIEQWKTTSTTECYGRERQRGDHRFGLRDKYQTRSVCQEIEAEESAEG